MGKKSRNKKENRNELLDLILRPVSDEQMETLSKKELLILLRGEQSLRKFFEEGYNKAQALNKELEDKSIYIEGVLVRLKNRLFSPKSEKSPKEKITFNKDSDPSKKKRPIKRERNLQKRYPEAEVIEQEVRLETLPTCPCCSGQMSESNRAIASK